MSRSISQVNSDKPLGGRYKVINQLGVGGFGRTFLAEDLHLPGHPRCVVKQLKPQFKSDDTLQMARRCFNTEAEVLYQLGNHDQIPRLLAHFEDNHDFYLAQEFIEGISLTKELVEGKPWSEAQVVALLKDILQVLSFVHEQQVIHRDLKPSNLIRRRSDGKIVLIDFGAVKQVSTQSYEVETGQTNLTISIGTQGYMPNEQLAGKPRFSSDIYAVGMLGIQALTGVHPRHLGDDEKGEIAWHHRAAHASPDLRDIIDQMVRYDFRDRYSSAIEALAALERLSAVSETVPPTFQPIPVIEIRTSNSGVSGSGEEPGKDHASPVNPEFSSVDRTVAGEESLSTALWVQPNSSEQPVPVSTHGTTNGTLNGTTNGTHLTTQAVGRPHPSEETEQSSAPASLPRKRHLVKPLIAATVLTTVISAVVGMRAIAPQFIDQLTNSERSTRSDTPTRITPATPPTPATPSLSSTDAKALFNHANQLMKEKKYDMALQYYDRSIALSSNNSDAYAGRCEALNQLNRPDEAIVACNDALAYEPGNIEALWSKGNALLLQDRTYEALKIYEDVTYYQPSFAPGWVKRGVALQQLGRSAEAVYALDQAISLQRNSAEAWSTKGEALLNLGRYDEAVVSLNKALQLQDPDDPKTLELREEARRLLGQ